MNETGKHRAGERGSGGFTLIELLVVVTILAILVALTTGIAREVIRTAAERETELILRSIHSLIQEYYEQEETWPTISGVSRSDELVTELNEKLGKDVVGIIGERYYYSNRIRDSWGNGVRYYETGGSGLIRQHFREKNEVPLLVSVGVDGTINTVDDIYVP